MKPEEKEVLKPTITAEEWRKMRESLEKLLEAFEGTDLDLDDSLLPDDDEDPNNFEFMYGKHHGDKTEEKKYKKENHENLGAMFEQRTELI